ncbi:MAG: PTS sugar transporter subunit IIB [Eubacteriales bacterium]
MKKILLVCSAGMSTSIVVKKMEAAAQAKGIEAKIWAVGDALAKDNVGEADIIMLGPQVKYLLEKMKGIAGDKPVGVIDMRDYGMMNGEAILNKALEMIG